MAKKKKGKYWYGTELADLQSEIKRYSKPEVEASKFSTSQCICGSNQFRLASDEDAGAAKRTCVKCGDEKLMGDSDEYAADANFEEHSCICEIPRLSSLPALACTRVAMMSAGISLAAGARSASLSVYLLTGVVSQAMPTPF